MAMHMGQHHATEQPTSFIILNRTLDFDVQAMVVVISGLCVYMS